jgi:hypothetical protein
MARNIIAASLHIQAHVPESGKKMQKTDEKFASEFNIRLAREIHVLSPWLCNMHLENFIALKLFLL